ncbi:MAG: CHRD domain-containing protein [Deltaproteobacteria bacterium]|nr:CHRD domain-containing protein [Deltaproteobacteria bacterium]
MRHLALALLATLGLTSSAGAATVTYNLTFGPEAMGATGTGSGTAVYDDVARTLAINVTWSGLSANTSVAHLHCCTAAAGTGTAGIAGDPGSAFPGGVQSGTFSITFDLTNPATYGATFLANSGGTPAGAEAALKAGMDAGKAYFNIHTTAFPGGEIRAFTAVPEPVLAGLLGAAGLALLGCRRRA